MDTKDRFSVFLDDPGLLALGLGSIAKVVAKVLDEPASDAAQRLRAGGGLVARDVMGPYAKAISRALASIGFGSFTVASDDVLLLPRARRVRRLRIGPDGLEVGGGTGKLRALPWSDVLAVHAHAVLHREGSDELSRLPRRADYVPSPRLSSFARQVVEAIQRFEARKRSGARVALGVDVIVSGPQIYRIASHEPTIYDLLEVTGAGHDHVLDKFLALLQRLFQALPNDVLVPPSNRRFLSRQDLTDVVFGSPQELDAFDSWLLQALAQGVGFGAEPEDVGDEVLADADEAVLVGGTLEDAEDVDDLDDEDLDDDEAEDEDDEAEAEDDEAEDDEAEDDEAEDDEAADDEAADDDVEAGATDDAWAEDEDDLVAEAEAAAAEADALDDDDLESVEAQVSAAVADEEVQAALEHFDRTRRLNREDVQAILSQSADLGELGDETTTIDDAELKEAIAFFDVSSGSWNVRELMEARAAEQEDGAAALSDSGDTTDGEAS